MITVYSVATQRLRSVNSFSFLLLHRSRRCVMIELFSCCVQYLNAHNGADVAVCAVVGFPLGAMSSGAKAFEAQRAIEDGASEIDMVIPVGRLKAASKATKDPQGATASHLDAVSYVVRDIAAVASVTKRFGCRLKVILETALLTDEEIELGVFLAGTAGADFVKTSTGASLQRDGHFAEGGGSITLFPFPWSGSIGAKDVSTASSSSSKKVFLVKRVCLFA